MKCNRDSIGISAKSHCSPRWIVGCLLMIIVAILPEVLSAQETSNIVVDLKTNLDESIVYADSLLLGRALNGRFEVPAMTKKIWLVPPEVDSWSISPLYAELSAVPGDTVALSMNFQYHYKLESIPFAAEVFFEQPNERVLLGETPLDYKSDLPLRGMLLVSKEGFKPKRFSPGEDLWNHHYVELELENEALAEEYWHPGKKSGRWLNILAGGAVIASGVAAIRFKSKADSRYDEYALSGDPALRGGFERYDRYAAISLGTMQAGIGFLAVRFVLDRK